MKPQISESSPRPATVEDLDRLVAIEKEVHVAPWTREHFQAEMEKPFSHVLVLTDDETDAEILGYVVYWQMIDESQILNVAVPTAHRGMGYALRLIRQVIRDGIQQKLKRVVLDVRKSNLAALHLYQKLGFLTARVQKNFYSNGEDGYAMELILDGEDVSKFLDF